MKMFMVVLAAFGCFGLCMSVFVSGVGTKPFVRNGQEHEAEALIRAVKTAAKQRAAKDVDTDYPEALCESPEYRFGLMDPLTVAEHVFEIRNTGDVPLVLQGGESSCKCTLSDLSEAVVAPGKTYSVKLTWNSGHANRDFLQSAVVRTNDPTSPEIRLTVAGQVKAVLSAAPEYINLDRLIPETKSSVDVLLFSQIWESIEVDRVEFTSQHLSAREIPVGSAATQVAFDSELKAATGTIALRVDYDGQAPMGPLNAKMRVYARHPENWTAESIDPTAGDAQQDTETGDTGKELPEISYPIQQDGTVLIEVDVHGDVVRRLSLYSPFVKAEGYIDLGNVPAKESQDRQWTIIGRIRGERVPDDVVATITKIPGLSVAAELQTSDKTQSSFKLTITTDERMRPAIYDRNTAGLLRIEAPGLGDSEVLEMPVNLYVLE